MKYGTMYEQGEIVIVPFPFSDLSVVKQRPVLILSKNEDNRELEDVITCGITSSIKNPKYSVQIDNENLVKGSIPLRSRIKVDKIFTLNKKIIRKSVAKINKETFEKVRSEFSRLV